MFDEKHHLRTEMKKEGSSWGPEILSFEASDTPASGGCSVAPVWLSLWLRRHTFLRHASIWSRVWTRGKRQKLLQKTASEGSFIVVDSIYTSAQAFHDKISLKTPHKVCMYALIKTFESSQMWARGKSLDLYTTGSSDKRSRSGADLAPYLRLCLPLISGAARPPSSKPLSSSMSYHSWV